MNEVLLALKTGLVALLKRHPKRVVGVFAAVMLGTGGGAFALASFAPDAAELPVHELLEPATALPLQAQEEM
ncbi:MAG: hypothetical protein WCH44_18730, partial [Betaproteobacteria bacterium]